jgi:hypothetical protein
MSKDSFLEIQENGYCVLRDHFSQPLIDACREGFWPILLAYLEAHRDTPNRGPHRHFLPMPFTAPCFVPEFFFDETVLRIVREAMGDRGWRISGAATRQSGARLTRVLTWTINTLCLRRFQTLICPFTCWSLASAWSP